ncbi:MAG: FAD-binding protein, partial [Acidobacteriota bacterium]
SNQQFRNWVENIRFDPASICEAESLEDLVEIIRTAEDEDRRVRAGGFGGSYTNILRTDGVVVRMRPHLTRVLGFAQGRDAWAGSDGETSPVLATALDDAVRASDRRLVHVEGGITVRELYLALDRPGETSRGRWGLLTMGGSGVLTVAGAMATGTHGMDFNLPPIADGVQVLHLIGPGGTHHWIERSAPRHITDRARVVAAIDDLEPENVHYDDDWFRAAIVSLGSLGVVYSVVLEAREQFGISQRVGSSTWTVIKELIREDGPAFTSNAPWDTEIMSTHDTGLSDRTEAVAPTPRGLEIILNPYRLSDNWTTDPMPDRRCRVVARAEASATDDTTDPTNLFDESSGGLAGGASLLQDFFSNLELGAGIAAFESGGPGTAKDIINGIIDGLSRPNSQGYPISYTVTDTFNPAEVDSPPPILSLEFVISTEGDQHIRMIDRFLDRFDAVIRSGGGRKLAGAFSIRFTRPSEGYLAMQYEEAPSPNLRFCHVELLVLMEVNALTPFTGERQHNDFEGEGEVFVREFYRVAQEMGARTHWGQVGPDAQCFFANSYPKLRDWLQVRDQLTDGGRLSTFDNEFSSRCLTLPTIEISPGCLGFLTNLLRGLAGRRS